MTLRAAFYDVEIEQDDEDKDTSQQGVQELDESVEMPYLEKRHSLDDVFKTLDDDSISPR